MPGCAVAKCGNYTRKTKGTEIKYYKFPTNNEDLCKQWIIACRREDKINLKHGKYLYLQYFYFITDKHANFKEI